MTELLILISFSYILLKLLITSISKDSKKIFTYRVRFLEIFILASLISYLFYTLFSKVDDKHIFVIPNEILWIGFVLGLILLGFGLGMRFITEHFQIVKSSKVFTLNEDDNNYHSIYANTWVNVNIIYLVFLLAVMELSSLSFINLKLEFVIGTLVISSIAGILSSLTNLQQHKTIYRTTNIVFALTILSLVGLFIESGGNFTQKFYPLATSFFVYSASYLVINLGSLLKFKLNKNNKIITSANPNDNVNKDKLVKNDEKKVLNEAKVENSILNNEISDKKDIISKQLVEEQKVTIQNPLKAASTGFISLKNLQN